MDFARIRDALAPYSHRDVTYAVLTLDRNGTYSGKAWTDTRTAYQELSRMSRVFLKRLNRWLEARGMDPVKSRWVGVAEAHRSGWPHMNLVLVSNGLARLLREEQDALISAGIWGRALIAVRGEIRAHVMESGWGLQSTLEPARSNGALAGYLVKMAGDVGKDGDAESRGQMAGEIAKLTQVPLNAPKHFRRLRSGRGFLPPRRKNGNTGAMFQHNGRAFGVQCKPEETDATKIAARKVRAAEVNAAFEALLNQGFFRPLGVLGACLG